MKWLASQFVWVIMFFAFLGYVEPTTMLWVKPFIPSILMAIMLAMGLTLELSHFKFAAKNWKVIALGTVLQFILMPALGFVLATVLNLPLHLVIGFVLVGSCPGGTASNVMVYLAKGNVAISVCLTMVSTLLCPLLTPLMVKIWSGELIVLDYWAVTWSVSKIALVPVVLGVFINQIWRISEMKWMGAMPVLSMIGIGLIVGCVLALNKSNLEARPWLVLIGVVLHNLSGLGIGYLAAWSMTKDKILARTLAIEVGMQNSGLGVHLAQTFFASSKMMALPAAIFSLWHNVSGVLVAKTWSGTKK